METQVMVSIIGEQTDPNGEVNRLEMMSEGRVYVKDGVHYIEYDEQEEMGPGQLHTQLAVTGDMISLVRKGDHTTHMVFVPGKKSYNTYQTPVGPMEMSIFPTLVRAEMNDQEGEIELDYQVELGGHYVGANLLSLVYRRQGKA